MPSTRQLCPTDTKLIAKTRSNVGQYFHFCTNYVLDAYLFVMLVVLGLTIYAALLWSLLLLGDKGHKRKALTPSTGFLSLDEITVLIPFRNEEGQLPHLLACIKASQKLPKNIFFINDHSEDKSMDVFASIPTNFTFERFELPSGTSGKKAALRFGLQHVTTPYVLTLDADIRFNSKYFLALEQLPRADLWVLPVVLQAENPLNAWQEVDVHVINAVNTGLYAFYRPVLCSGANLLFHRERYFEADDWDKHQHVSSGDDMFTLRAFRKAKNDIRLLSDQDLAVYTHTPKGIAEFLSQRLRWLGKTSKVNDAFAHAAALFQGVLSLLFMAWPIYLLLIGEAQIAGLLWLGKSLIDLVAHAPHFLRYQRWYAWFLVPIFQSMVPVYYALLFGLSLFISPSWKGRKVAV